MVMGDVDIEDGRGKRMGILHGYWVVGASGALISYV